MNVRKNAAAAVVVLAVPIAAQADDLKIGYVNKMGDHPWFVAEVAGAAEAAQNGGAEFVSQDVQFNADLTIATLDTMIGDGVDGIAIVVPDRALGPVVAARAEEAGIPLIAVDDDITFEDGSPVPYVGMNAHNIGLIRAESTGDQATEETILAAAIPQGAAPLTPGTPITQGAGQ